jgi:hypothetical protein
MSLVIEGVKTYTSFAIVLMFMKLFDLVYSHILNKNLWKDASLQNDFLEFQIYHDFWEHPEIVNTE